MPRRLPVPLLALLCPLVAPAAPVPKETPAEVMRRVYGEAADRDAKVTCEGFGKDGLRVAVPEVKAGNGKRRAVLAPVATREVDGDFALTFRVALRFDPDSAGPGGQATVSAGVFVFDPADPTTGVQADCRCLRAARGWVRQAALAAVTRGKADRVLDKLDPPADAAVWLRLTRRGDEFACEWSDDGEKWEETERRTLRLAAAVRVGPGVSATWGGECAAAFDKYELKPLPAKTDVVR